MEFSALYNQYNNMDKPSYILKVGKVSISTGADIALQRMECELTCHPESGYLLVEAYLNPEGEHAQDWIKSFQAGEKCSLSLGYEKEHVEIFSGFLYEISWDVSLSNGALELSALFLDVRGRLMISSCADAGSARTISQLVKTILDQGFCKDLSPKQTIGEIPKDWDLPAQRSGLSDYEVICKAADFLCYEFYACGTELYFGKPRSETSPIITFQGINGLIELKRKRTLAHQCAAIVVSGTDDKGEQILARVPRKKDKGYGTEKMSSALSNDIYQPEATVRTMAQAKYLAQARMEQRQYQSGGIYGKCIGVPEMRPGRFIKVEELTEPANGTYYVHTVRHVLDIDGYRTYFEAED